MDNDTDELKLSRKKAANVAMLLGGLAFCLGALICLIYLLMYKPWKKENFYESNPTSAERTNPNRN